MASFLKGTVKVFFAPLLLLCFVYNIPLRSLKILGSSHLMHYTVKIDIVFSGSGSELFPLKSLSLHSMLLGWISSKGIPVVAPLQLHDERSI